ncbi:conjugation TrbI-like protein [Granulicella rosea]|uniref:Conjugation TrbI-like protein n=1 Tax=Granulicella rosea TaxID=474952 RepID=A0A239E6H9_9BACT|nr:hypothetical protein [Granulicella rosea]SNS40227.1 conjugation TrbI-like protein [Granulicella rosea]
MTQIRNQKETNANVDSERLNFEGTGSMPLGTGPTGENSDAASPDDIQDRALHEPVTRADVRNSEKPDTKRLVVLGAGLMLAIMFFVFTALVGKSSKKAATPPAALASAKSQVVAPPKGSVTPLMDSEHTVPANENSNGQLQPNDIRRTRNAVKGSSAPHIPNPTRGTAGDNPPPPPSLGSIPSFADTQQHWQDPSANDPAASNVALARPSRETHEQSALKENSLVFVRAPLSSSPAISSAQSMAGDTSDRLTLHINPGTRVQAKLQTQISSAVQAPVVAVIEYTYALGDKVVIPAGARVYGKLQQADRSGLIGVSFDEIELLDGKREKIDAIGVGLDLGPIKGEVTGKNTGRNILVRAATGMGSLLAELAGNNSSGAFSEDDMLRERLAANIGAAGDSQIMNLNANSRVVVSVPADTKIYVVFAKHEQKNATVRKIDQ